jgi:hypothetical protein
MESLTLSGIPLFSQQLNKRAVVVTLAEATVQNPFTHGAITKRPGDDAVRVVPNNCPIAGALNVSASRAEAAKILIGFSLSKAS